MERSLLFKRLAVLFLVITAGFWIINYDVLMSESIWIYDKGSLLGMEVRSIVNDDSVHTIIDDMIREYGLEVSDNVYFRLDSSIRTLDPVGIAEGVVSFEMPYDVSVSNDKSSFRVLKRFVIPIFMPRNYREVEAAFQALEGVEFSAKHYYIADSFWWYLSFELNGSRVKLSINIKKDGWLDGYEIEVTTDNVSESLQLVWNGVKEPVYTPEANRKAFYRGIATGLFFTTIIFAGLWLRTRIHLKSSPSEIREALYVVRKRIEMYGETYSLIWKLFCISSVVIGLVAAYGTVITDSDLLAVLLLIYGVAATAILLIIGAWISNLRKLATFKHESGEIFIGVSSIVPMIIAVTTWFIGMLALSHIFAPENIGFEIIFTIIITAAITPLIFLMLKLINPKTEIENTNKKIQKIIKELEKNNIPQNHYFEDSNPTASYIE